MRNGGSDSRSRTVGEAVAIAARRLRQQRIGKGIEHLALQVVPLTSTLRSFGSEVRLTADARNGLDADSSAQCQHIRSVSTERVETVKGNIGLGALTEIRQVLGLILDSD